ncbi:hypothetical protein GCM10010254_34780 [Streptomyces chromofuscus]|nr:hypothetical protein GCM10010254_34780 [Streptomyces chromofuscus]
MGAVAVQLMGEHEGSHANTVAGGPGLGKGACGRGCRVVTPAAGAAQALGGRVRLRRENALGSFIGTPKLGDVCSAVLGCFRALWDRCLAVAVVCARRDQRHKVR